MPKTGKAKRAPGLWPMTEAAQKDEQAPSAPRSSEPDQEAHTEAQRIEATTQLPRTGRPPPAFDRDVARALVDAGYMPLSDYVAIYNDQDARREASSETQANAPFHRRKVSARSHWPTPKALRRLTQRKRRA